jgi:hypothetical protein
MACKISTHVAFGLAACSLMGLGACKKTLFGGGKPTPIQEPDPQAEPVATQGTVNVPSPNETDTLGTSKPINPKVECAGNYRGIRMAIVIDTSHSMGASLCNSPSLAPGGGQELNGSDPARVGASIRGQNECFTDRQNAAWHIVTRTAARDREGEKTNSTFMGSAVGIAHFPAGTSDVLAETYAKISGEPPLNSAMTSLSGVTADEAFKNALWTSLGRTQNITGNTPYLAALSAGRDLLKTGRDPNDPRRDVLFLITDGLPSDQRPSQVLARRKEIKDVDVVYLYMFDPGVDEAARQESAKSALRNAFEKLDWARRPGNTDGYGLGDFEKYWADLKALPAKIATARIDVTKPADLVSKIDGVLGIVQSCK